MFERPRRYHYAFVPVARGGKFEVTHLLEFASRGEADRASLRFLPRWGDSAAISTLHELNNGDLVEPAVIGRAPPPARPRR
jgi:hypothetical protein